MSEEHLIRHCAPTLAGIKTGSLFTCFYTSRDQLCRTVRNLNNRLRSRGLRILPLQFTPEKALMYVYRPSELRRDLSQSAARKLLEERGYCAGTCENCIVQLADRLRQGQNFPHEIGLFLGYPPEDVEGFMANNACHSKCSGCWKVYGDEDAARHRFDQYKKCSRIYRQCWEQGTALERLVVTR